MRKALQMIVAMLSLGAVVSLAEGTSALSLAKADFALAIPAMVARDGVVYVAYRSFDWLRSSAQLQVLAFDLGSRKELRRATIALPKVTGVRISDGFAISLDGMTLAYVEMSDPVIIILLRADNLSEVRRSGQLPFSGEDRRRHFAGFDRQKHLSFESVNRDQPRFVRLSSADFSRFSDVTASRLKQKVFSYIAWNPTAQRFWLPSTDIVGSREYTEQGEPTGEVLQLQGRQLEQGAIALGQAESLAFFGQLSKGTVVSHQNHQDRQLELPCVPSVLGASTDSEYIGAICVTHPDLLPESSGDRVSSSELLLIKTREPEVVWRQKLVVSSVTGGGELQQVEPAFVRQNGKMFVLIPSKSSELTLDEVALPK